MFGLLIVQERVAVALPSLCGFAADRARLVEIRAFTVRFVPLALKRGSKGLRGSCYTTHLVPREQGERGLRISGPVDISLLAITTIHFEGGLDGHERN